MRPRRPDGRVPADRVAPPEGAARRRRAGLGAARHLGLVPHHARVQGRGVHPAGVVRPGRARGARRPARAHGPAGRRCRPRPPRDRPHRPPPRPRGGRGAGHRARVLHGAGPLGHGVRAPAHPDRPVRPPAPGRPHPRGRRTPAGAVRLRRQRRALPARRRPGPPLRRRPGRRALGRLDAGIGRAPRRATRARRVRHHRGRGLPQAVDRRRGPRSRRRDHDGLRRRVPGPAQHPVRGLARGRPGPGLPGRGRRDPRRARHPRARTAHRPPARPRPAHPLHHRRPP